MTPITQLPVLSSCLPAPIAEEETDMPLAQAVPWQPVPVTHEEDSQDVSGLVRSIVFVFVFISQVYGFPLWEVH